MRPRGFEISAPRRRRGPALALALGLAACGRPGDDSRPAGPAPRATAGAAGTSPGATASAPATPGGRAAAPDALPPHRAFRSLADALAALVPAETRALGLGELHQRTGRAQARSTLARFTAEGLPALAARASDLVVETWLVDPRCGAGAVAATARLEAAVERPPATKDDLGRLVEAARAAGVQPRAMTLRCADYETVAPARGEVDPVAMLTLTTRELARVAGEALAPRGPAAPRRPLVLIYGGALHNDRFPEPGVAEWSYAAGLDAATGGRYVELDLIAPELAAGDAASARQPWFPLVAAAADQVLVYARGERSFVAILPRQGR